MYSEIKRLTDFKPFLGDTSIYAVGISNKMQ